MAKTPDITQEQWMTELAKYQPSKNRKTVFTEKQLAFAEKAHKDGYAYGVIVKVLKMTCDECTLQRAVKKRMEA